MKTNLLSRFCSLVRWTSGTALAAAIMVGSCFFFPALTSCLPALVLTCALAVLIGLQVALPPINPEDDWVPIRERKPMPDKHPAKEVPVLRKTVKIARAHVPARIPLQPIHAARGHGVPVYRTLQPGHRYHHAHPAHHISSRNHRRHHDSAVPHTIGHN